MYFLILSHSAAYPNLTWSTANIDPTPGENPYPTESHGKFDRYFPTILNAQTVREIDIGKYLLVLLTAVNSSDVVGYAHLLVAFDKTTHEPRFVVAAEKNDTPGAGLESHFLGGFSGKGHINYGESDDWADIEKFEIRAREIVMKELILCRNEWE